MLSVGTMGRIHAAYLDRGRGGTPHGCSILTPGLQWAEKSQAPCAAVRQMMISPRAWMDDCDATTAILSWPYVLCPDLHVLIEKPLWPYRQVEMNSYGWPAQSLAICS